MSETLSHRIDRIASALRRLFIEDGLVHSPDHPTMSWKELPEDRKDRWRTVAAVYVHVFKS